MNITPIFSQFLVDDYIDVDNEKIEKYCYELKEKSDGVKISNEGGWQSNNLDFKINNDLLKLVHEIRIKIVELNKLLGYEDNEFVVNNGWVNINGKKDFNSVHIHGSSFYSAVYYVKGGENKGNIVFCNPIFYFDGLMGMNKIKSYGLYNSTEWFYPPVTGRLLIFPSWLTHYVKPNLTDEDRISIAFNFSLSRK